MTVYVNFDPTLEPDGTTMVSLGWTPFPTVLGTGTVQGGKFVVSTTSGSTTLTITAVTSGAVVAGNSSSGYYIEGAGIPTNTRLSAYGTGSGGVGTYTMTNAATATATGVIMYAGPWWRVSGGALIWNLYGGSVGMYPRIAFDTGAPLIRGQVYLRNGQRAMIMLAPNGKSFAYIQRVTFTGTGGGEALNVITWQDGALTAASSFTASTTNASTTISVTALGVGPIYLGRVIIGAGIPTGSYIVSQTSGTANGIGVYVISNAATATATGVAVTTTAQLSYRINYNSGTVTQSLPSVALFQWVISGSTLNLYFNGALQIALDLVGGTSTSAIPIPQFLVGSTMAGYYPPNNSGVFGAPLILRDNNDLLLVTDVASIRFDRTTSKLRINVSSTVTGSPDVTITVQDAAFNVIFTGTTPISGGIGSVDTTQIPKGLELTTLLITANDGVDSIYFYYDMPSTVTLQPFKLGNNGSQATYFSGYNPYTDKAKIIRYRTASATSLPVATIASFGTGTGGTGTYVMSAAATQTQTGVLAVIGTRRYYASITSGSTTLTVTSVIDGGTIATGQTIANQSNDFILSSWMDPTVFAFEGWAPSSYVGMQSNGSPTKFPDDTTDTIRTNLCWYTKIGNIIWDMRQAPNLTWAFSGTLTDWNVDLNYYATNIHRIRVTAEFIPNLRLDYSRNGTANQGLPTTAWSMSMVYEGTNPAVQPWDSQYIDWMTQSGMAHIRYMTDQAANEIGSPSGPGGGMPAGVFTAANRMLPTNQGWLGYGAEPDSPIEAIITLHNTVGKNIWHTISRVCSESYVRELASLYRDTLDPDLQVTFELSNEVWNHTFVQSLAYKAEGFQRGIAKLGNGGEFLATTVNGDTTLTVTSFKSGQLPTSIAGTAISGPGIPAGATLSAIITGSGGVGTYDMSVAATADATGVTIWAGASATTAANILADTTSGSRLITVSTVSIGTIAAGQPINGAGIPAGAAISKTTVTANITSGSTTLTVTAVASPSNGTIAAGMPVSGTGIPAGTTIASVGTGLGGVGTYVMSAAATATTTGVSATVGAGTGTGGTGTYYLNVPATATASGVAMHVGPSIYGEDNGTFAPLTFWSGQATYNVGDVVFADNGGQTAASWRCHAKVTNAIATGQSITGTGVPAGRTIASFGTGTGGAGTYVMSGNANASGTNTMTIGASSGVSAGGSFSVTTVSGSATITVVGHPIPVAGSANWTLWQGGQAAPARAHAEGIALMRSWIADEWPDKSRWNVVAGTWQNGWSQDVGEYLTWGRLAEQIDAVAPAPYFGNDTFDYETAPADVRTAVLTMTGAPRIAAFQAAAQSAADLIKQQFIDNDRDLAVRLRAMGLSDTAVQIWAYEGGWSFNCKMSNSTLASFGAGPIDQTAFHDDWFAFKRLGMYDIYVSFYGGLRDQTGGWITHFQAVGPPYPGVLTTNYGTTWYVSESMTDRAATSSTYTALADVGGGPSPPIVPQRLLPGQIIS